MKSEKTYPTYRQFYDTALFKKIKQDVPNGAKTCAIGLEPSILSYNGFYTLDGYFVSYPLAYKHRFRKVIAKELEKSTELKDYFDKWGSRCYIFSSELGKENMNSKTTEMEIENIEINVNILRNMGGQYIFSAVPLCNYQDLDLKFVKSYTNEDSFWKIYVYKL